ncbi:MAG: hypothetical protein COV34_00150 [Candidatus Zambryskibacteria bacterium CG10_big_fil_rev_8_21_14_0_10_42_12]|uniref:Uncharacterized protein n=1 Tax=Candidatus Zambryskibacteria bacterium CG10_big_fil_rev_8_21_14_0_10_42_12 TaxID=1975115 RepID=A0A2H0QX42_9BACT|nr:MAG: hypothetical protein COV34_00150 [Candidatus Zambryskibacteria bacterium CG10_big_fil_rev_8_21_14_0_10_42_12]
MELERGRGRETGVSRGGRIRKTVGFRGVLVPSLAHKTKESQAKAWGDFCFAVYIKSQKKF